MDGDGSSRPDRPNGGEGRNGISVMSRWSIRHMARVVVDSPPPTKSTQVQAVSLVLCCAGWLPVSEARYCPIPFLLFYRSPFFLLSFLLSSCNSPPCLLASNHPLSPIDSRAKTTPIEQVELAAPPSAIQRDIRPCTRAVSSELLLFAAAVVAYTPTDRLTLRVATLVLARAPSLIRQPARDWSINQLLPHSTISACNRSHPPLPSCSHCPASERFCYIIPSIPSSRSWPCRRASETDQQCGSTTPLPTIRPRPSPRRRLPHKTRLSLPTPFASPTLTLQLLISAALEV